MTIEQLKKEMEKLVMHWRTKSEKIERRFANESPRETQVATHGLTTCAEELEDLIKEIK